MSHAFKVLCKICGKDFLTKISETAIHSADLSSLTCSYFNKEFQIAAVDIVDAAPKNSN
jgi:hypothetical protein